VEEEDCLSKWKGSQTKYFLGDNSGLKTDSSYKLAWQQYQDFLSHFSPTAVVSVPTVPSVSMPQSTSKRLSDFASNYFSELKIRFEAKEVSSSYYSQTKQQVESFIASIGNLEASSLNEETLSSYRRTILSKVAANEISPYTAKSYFITVKGFVMALWKSRLIDMPRNLDDFGKVSLPEPEVRTLTVQEIRDLWYFAGTTQQRLYIALGLNMACGQQDISDMKPSEIQGDFIKRNRSKTNVPCCYRLWQVTKQLIEACRNGNENRLFQTAKGNPLVLKTIRNGKKIHNDSIRLVFERLCDKAGLKGHTFYELRKTAVTELARLGYSADVQEAFLGHAARDSRDMRKHYVKKDVASEANFGQLERGLLELEKIFGLTIDKPITDKEANG